MNNSEGEKKVNIVNRLKNAFNSYSKNIQITLYILFALVLGLVIFGIQILFFGLGFTNMTNVFAWGAWIIGDLSLIVIGGGAFTSGFLLYILRRDDLKPVINAAVLVGFLCYTFTFAFLLFDIGQPIRFWFGYLYPNWGAGLMPQSMLTEIFFCITLYWSVLLVEMIPIILGGRLLDKNPIIHRIGHYMHVLMWIMAAAGTFFSFFHQGSLGGTYGVLYAKPGWHRMHHMLFFLCIVSAVSAGPSFTALTTWISSKVLKKELIPMHSRMFLAKWVGRAFIVYATFRFVDIYVMTSVMAPASDRNFFDMWGGYYGVWMLTLELIFTVAPVILLNSKGLREQDKFYALGMASGTMAVVMNRTNVTLHGFSVPNFPWKPFAAYMPSIQEWMITFGVFATMILLYMWCVRYLPIFGYYDEIPETYGEGHGHDAAEH